MAIPTTVNIPEHLHERLSERAKAAGASIPELILSAIEDAYGRPVKAR